MRLRNLSTVVALATTATAGCGRAGRGQPDSGAPRPTPVQTAKVEQHDISIALEGLGSATGFYTVTVRSRVDGELVHVAFKEGQEVKKGDLLVQIDPRPYQIAVNQAQATLDKDKAQATDGQLNLDRYLDLRKQNLISQQQVDDQRALAEGQRAQVASDQASLDNAKLQLQYARITSPIDGITGLRQVDPGNMVHAADTTGLVVITQLDPIAVLITLPADDLPQLADEMQKHPLSAQAFTRDGLVDLGTGVVQLIDNQINQATGTLKLKAIFPNANHRLWPNQFLKARVQVSTRKGALVIPSVAVQRGPDGPFVYRVKGDSTVEAVRVVLGPLQGESQVIESGVAAGDEIVVEGQYKLRPGASVDTKGPRPGAGDGGPSPGGVGAAK